MKDRFRPDPKFTSHHSWFVACRRWWCPTKVLPFWWKGGSGSRNHLFWRHHLFAIIFQSGFHERGLFQLRSKLIQSWPSWLPVITATLLLHSGAFSQDFFWKDLPKMVNLMWTKTIVCNKLQFLEVHVEKWKFEFFFIFFKVQNRAHSNFCNNIQSSQPLLIHLSRFIL